MKTIRENKGLSQQQLGKKLGVAQQTVAQYEKTSNIPKFATLKRIAKALDVPVVELYPDETRILLDMFSGTGFSAEKSYQSIIKSTEKNNKSDVLFDEMKLDIQLQEMKKLMNQLNETGQEKAVEQVEMLTKIPEYRKEK